MRHRLGFLLGWPALSPYAAHPTAALRLPTAYMLLEHIGPGTGRMLSSTWDLHRGDAARRRTLFRDMSRIMLSLARVPQPRIGSFRFCPDDGTVALTNRPLPCALIILENDGAPRTLPAGRTYACVEPFVTDMLALQDASFLANRNAVYDAGDCRAQMAARTLLRTLSYRFASPEQRNGPFRLQLTDLHASNIFVDDDWNLTCLIDLEWVSALPVEALAVPYWLTGRGIDQLVDQDLVEFDKVHEEFMEVFDEVEAASPLGGGASLAGVIRESWESGTVWLWHCLTCVDAIISLVQEHVAPRYFGMSVRVEVVLSQYWCQGAEEVVKQKVAEHKEYAEELGALFKTNTP